MIRPIQPRPDSKSPSPKFNGHSGLSGENSESGQDVARNAKSTTLGLESLASQEEAQIDSLMGPETLKRRLMEIGFVPGSAVRFEMATPFGDPLIFSLRGSKIALRRNEAQCVRFTR